MPLPHTLIPMSPPVPPPAGPPRRRAARGRAIPAPARAGGSLAARRGTRRRAALTAVGPWCTSSTRPDRHAGARPRRRRLVPPRCFDMAVLPNGGVVLGSSSATCSRADPAWPRRPAPMFTCSPTSRVPLTQVRLPGHGAPSIGDGAVAWTRPWLSSPVPCETIGGRGRTEGEAWLLADAGRASASTGSGRSSPATPRVSRQAQLRGGAHLLLARRGRRPVSATSWICSAKPGVDAPMS